MEQGHPSGKASVDSVFHLGRHRNLRHQQNPAASQADAPLQRTQVHLCLATARDAVEQYAARRRSFVIEKSPHVGRDAMLLRREGWQQPQLVVQGPSPSIAANPLLGQKTLFDETPYRRGTKPLHGDGVGNTAGMFQRFGKQRRLSRRTLKPRQRLLLRAFVADVWQQQAFVPGRRARTDNLPLPCQDSPSRQPIQGRACSSSQGFLDGSFRLSPSLGKELVNGLLIIREAGRSFPCNSDMGAKAGPEPRRQHEGRRLKEGRKIVATQPSCQF